MCWVWGIKDGNDGVKTSSSKREDSKKTFQHTEMQKLLEKIQESTTKKVSNKQSGCDGHRELSYGGRIDHDGFLSF